MAKMETKRKSDNESYDFRSLKDIIQHKIALSLILCKIFIILKVVSIDASCKISGDTVARGHSKGKLWQFPSILCE